MKVLLLAYPLTPVRPTSCGGTEQILYHLLGGLPSRRDLDLHWVAAEGSRTKCAPCHFTSWPDLLRRFGVLRPHPLVYSPEALADLDFRCNLAALQLVRQLQPELVHIQGAPFFQVAGQAPCPVLFTLHLARSLYPANMLRLIPPNLHLQCVSHTQAAGYGAVACCGVVPNGIDLGPYLRTRRACGPNAPLLYLGRICPEKGAHLAIAVARRARRPLWIVGAVAPFPSHLEYFLRRIAPELDADIRWLPPPAFPVKRRLLSQAAAVVIPSLVEETSSLVAMEAAAAGVPVLALRAGALPEIVAEGVTGYLAADPEDLEAAVARLPAIDSGVCRTHARRHFSARRMARDYLRLYRRLAPDGHAPAVPQPPPSV